MNDELVTFKGTRDGIHIILDDCAPYDQLFTELLQKLDKNRRFFAGASVIIHSGDRVLADYERDELFSILVDQYGLEVQRLVDKEEIINKDISSLKTQFVQRTVRSGQYIHFDGHIVIVGDLNAGAEVVATGNICVLGAIRGLAHAGVDGNKDAFVACNSFVAPNVQVRIANIIVRGPDDDSPSSTGPEIAVVKDDNIIVQSLGNPGYY